MENYDILTQFTLYYKRLFPKICMKQTAKVFRIDINKYRMSRVLKEDLLL